YSVNTGSIQVSFGELINGLITGTNGDVQVIRDLRLPRIIIAVFAGASLSVSGVLLQAVMRNPLAEPGIIGVSSGAGFMAMLLVSIFPTLYFYMPFFAFLGGALAFFLVYSISWKSGLDPLRMILIGVAINAIFTSLSQTFNYRGSYTTSMVQEVTTSTLAMKKWSDVEIMVIYGTVGLILAVAVYAWCNYLGLEDKTAKS
ncbi:iron ABC transporter permease, partial [Butyricicoccus sp. 1XD8-22]